METYRTLPDGPVVKIKYTSRVQEPAALSHWCLALGRACHMELQNQSVVRSWPNGLSAQSEGFRLLQSRHHVSLGTELPFRGGARACPTSCLLCWKLAMPLALLPGSLPYPTRALPCTHRPPALCGKTGLAGPQLLCSALCKPVGGFQRTPQCSVDEMMRQYQIQAVPLPQRDHFRRQDTWPPRVVINFPCLGRNHHSEKRLRLRMIDDGRGGDGP